MNGGGWAVWSFDPSINSGLRTQDGSVRKKPSTMSMSKCVFALNYA